MANEVANAAPNMGALVSGLRRTRAKNPSFGGKGYLKFAKDGEFTLGKEGTVVNGERAILNMTAMMTGFVCWTNYPDKENKKNELLGEVMAPVTAPEPIQIADLEDHAPWEWKTAQKIEGRLVTGDRAEFQFNTSSYGGLKALDAVMEAVLDRIDEGEDVYLFPVVEIKANSYVHDRWGKTYEPVFDIVTWADVNGDFEGEAPSAKVEDKGQAQDPEPKAEPEDDEAPVRRRRRQG